MASEPADPARALAESETRLRAVLENIADGVVTIRADGTIELWNRAAAELFGWSAAEIVGRNVSLLVTGTESHGGHEGHVRRYLDTGEGRIIGKGPRALVGRHRSGAPIPIDVAVSVVPGTAPPTFIATLRDASVRRRTEDELRHLATHDALTGLPNRTLLLDRIGHALATARRSAERVAVLFVDLDRFKPINDALGHDVGDRVLQEIARRFEHGLRASDTVARLGGDEFVVVARVGCPEDAATIAAKLERAASAPVRIGEHVLQVGASTGIALGPDDATAPAELVRRADAAMYQCKRARRPSLPAAGAP